MNGRKNNGGTAQTWPTLQFAQRQILKCAASNADRDSRRASVTIATGGPGESRFPIAVKVARVFRTRRSGGSFPHGTHFPTGIAGL